MHAKSKSFITKKIAILKIQYKLKSYGRRSSSLTARLSSFNLSSSSRFSSTKSGWSSIPRIATGWNNSSHQLWDPQLQGRSRLVQDSSSYVRVSLSLARISSSLSLVSSSTCFWRVSIWEAATRLEKVSPILVSIFPNGISPDRKFKGRSGSNISPYSKPPKSHPILQRWSGFGWRSSRRKPTPNCRYLLISVKIIDSFEAIEAWLIVRMSLHIDIL